MVNKCRGRPRGRSNARERLVNAATELFLRDGFTRTTTRRIAEIADVDHSLVNYYFGGKQGLFAVVMDLLISPAELVDHVAAQGVHGLAPRLLNALLTAWDNPDVLERSRRLLAGIQTDTDTQEAFRGYLDTHVTSRLATLLGGRHAHARAATAAAVIAGLFLTRYVVRIEPVATMDRAGVVQHFGPVLHTCLAPAAPPRR
jgi:AcrR family transcriptional regulator